VGAAVHDDAKRKMFDAKVTVDGEVLLPRPGQCVLVGNTGSLKGRVDAFPDASPTDGRLHVAVVSATGMREWASLMARACAASGWRSLEIREGTAITVKFDGKRRFELDGGVKGKAKKLDFEIRPRSLVVCAR
jgi:diacylglycerol kinase family enzyme